MNHPQPPPTPRSLVLAVSARPPDRACWLATTSDVSVACDGFQSFEPDGDVALTGNDLAFRGLIAALEHLLGSRYFDHAVKLVLDAPFVVAVMNGRQNLKSPRWGAYCDRVNDLLRDLRAASVEFLPPSRSQE